MSESRPGGSGPRSEQFLRDPYPVYARLRADAAVHRFGDLNGMQSWFVAGYGDVREALSDRRLAKDPRRPGAPRRRQLSGRTHPLARNMLSTDPPDHTRLRRLVSRAFTPRRIEERLRPRVQQITDRLLDAIGAGGEVDLIDGLAFPLPVTVICELLGVPSEDRDQFRAWSDTMITPDVSPGADERRMAAGAAMRGYLSDLTAARRPGVRADLPEDEQPDLISVLIAARDGADALSEVELISTLVLLLIAGHETTVNLISVGMLALLQHPDQLRLLRERPELGAVAVEELLRFTSPVQRASFRYASEEIEIGGVTIPSGAMVSLGIASGNRDGSHFAEPDRLDITRADNPHLAFGHGIHFCLGAPLARQEGQIAFASLLRQFSGIELAVPAAELRWRPGLLRGLIELPLRLTV
ncbi:MAG TPA: cytochrome P450 [Candidatus Dormibacteraeota bacterium]|jgi:cytochrome P450|nr:cytochrome P450 [Candidatus Dormibacteraeota bacterium]